MSSPTPAADFRARVRYAECNAHGELALAGYVNFFGEAAAQALRRLDVDLRVLTARDGELRESACDVSIRRSPAYDEEVAVDVGLEALQDDGFSLHFALRPVRGADLLATGQLRYEIRQRSGTPMRTMDAGLRDRIRQLKT